MNTDNRDIGFSAPRRSCGFLIDYTKSKRNYHSTIDDHYDDQNEHRDHIPSQGLYQDDTTTTTTTTKCVSSPFRLIRKPGIPSRSPQSVYNFCDRRTNTDATESDSDDDDSLSESSTNHVSDHNSSDERSEVKTFVSKRSDRSKSESCIRLHIPVSIPDRIVSRSLDQVPKKPTRKASNQPIEPFVLHSRTASDILERSLDSLPCRPQRRSSFQKFFATKTESDERLLEKMNCNPVESDKLRRWSETTRRTSSTGITGMNRNITCTGSLATSYGTSKEKYCYPLIKRSTLGNNSFNLKLVSSNVGSTSKRKSLMHNKPRVIEDLCNLIVQIPFQLEIQEDNSYHHQTVVKTNELNCWNMEKSMKESNLSSLLEVDIMTSRTRDNATDCDEERCKRLQFPLDSMPEIWETDRNVVLTN